MKVVNINSGHRVLYEVYFYLRSLMLPISDIHNNLPKKGRILDLGCGSGSLLLMLSRFSRRRELIGWDLNGLRINDALKRSSGSERLLFYKRNAVTSKIPKISGAIASDFLHHISKNNQKKIIKKIHSSLEKNGVLVIKETDQDDFIRHQLSKLWDKMFYPEDRPYYKGRGEWVKLLEGLGFSVLVKNCVLWFPGSTKLFICKKK